MKAQRIYLIGAPGSGKTYLGQRLSKLLHISYYELDDLFFARKYDIKRDSVQRDRMFRDLISRKQWILDGVYPTWAADGLRKSDLVVLLERPFLLVTYRILTRYLLRLGKHEESLTDVVKLLRYAWSFTRGKTPDYIENKHLLAGYRGTVVSIRNQNDLERFVESLTS